MNSTPRPSEKRIAVNTASNYVAFAVTTVVQFFLIRYLIGVIGETYYGLQALANQALQFVSLASMAIGAGYNRFATEHYARRDFGEMNATLSAGFALSLCSAALLAVGTVCIAVYVRPLFDLQADMVPAARAVMAITGAAMAFHIIAGAWKSPVFILERFYLNAVGGIVAAVASAAAVVAVFGLTTPSIVLWVLIQSGFRVGAELFIVIPCAVRALPELRISLRRAFSQRHMRALATFSGMSFLGGIGSLLYYATDSILIANLDELSFAHVTFYNVAQRWNPMILGVITAFAGVLTPLLTSDWARGNEARMRSTLLRALRYSLVLAVYPCVVLFVLAQPFFTHWLGSRSDIYITVSAPVMQIGMVGLLCTVPGAVAYEALFASGRIRPAVIATLVGGIANIALSIWFVKALDLGLVGIALGSTLSLAVVNTVCIPMQTGRVIHLGTGALIRQSLLSPLAGAVPLAALCLVFRNLWPAPNLALLFVQFALAALFYAPCVWFVSLVAADRAKIRDALAALRRRA